MGTIFYRIDEDVKAGRKKKACDRLRNLINEFPDDISLREKLGRIYYDSGKMKPENFGFCLNLRILK